MRNTAARINATQSANAPAYKIPIIQNVYQKMKNAGIRIITCLDNDKKALILLFQMAWKKIHAGIWIQKVIQKSKKILNAKHANSSYKASQLPKIHINVSGILWNNVNAIILIILLVIRTSFNASLTLLYAFAQ